MFRDDDVALLDLKMIVKGAAPCAFRKRLTLASAELIGRRILPVHVIARFPPVMGHVIDLDAGLAGRAHNGARSLPSELKIKFEQSKNRLAQKLQSLDRG